MPNLKKTQESRN